MASKCFCCCFTIPFFDFKVTGRFESVSICGFKNAKRTLCSISWMLKSVSSGPCLSPHQSEVQTDLGTGAGTFVSLSH